MMHSIFKLSLVGLPWEYLSFYFSSPVSGRRIFYPPNSYRTGSLPLPGTC